MVGDYHDIVVVSDGTDLGEIADIEMDDVTINYQDYTYISPDVTYYGSEGVYYCTFYDYNWDTAPFDLGNDGYLDGSYGRGSEEVTCYVVDAEGNVFCDTFEIEVKFSPIQWIIYYLLFGWIWWY